MQARVGRIRAYAMHITVRDRAVGIILRHQRAGTCPGPRSGVIKEPPVIPYRFELTIYRFVQTINQSCFGSLSQNASMNTAICQRHGNKWPGRGTNL
jgi:hypothetical protein